MPTPYTPADRRPVNARDWKLTDRIAELLASAGISANAISVSSVVFCALAALCFFATSRVDPPMARVCWMAGALLILTRGMANVLDGMVAIRSGKASARGELFNDMPDRLSDAFIHVGFGYAAFSSIELGWIAAILAIITAYVRVLGKACGAPSDFRGPMAKTQRMYLLAAGAAYCAVTPLHWQTIGSYGVPAVVLLLIVIGCIATIIRRLQFISRALEALHEHQ